jgi:ankyrin repeat protein
VRILVNILNADSSKASNDGVTPLVAASLQKHEKVVSWLTEKLSFKEKSKEAANIKACHAGDLIKLRRLTQGVPVTSEFPLYTAAAAGHLDVTRYLIRVLGADVNKAIDQGHTPLTIAAFMGHLDMVRCLVEELGADAPRNCIWWSKWYGLVRSSPTGPRSYHAVLGD